MATTRITYPPFNPTSLSWASISGKPTEFPPSAHTHIIADVTNLQIALDNKAASVHTHDIADVNNLQTYLNGKAALVHTHTISDVTGLQAALDSKAANIISSPTTRTVAVGTAYQATTSTKPAFVSVNITSTANFSLIGGTTNTADIVIGPTSAIATTGGTVVGKYSNSVTGTIAIGLNMNSVQAIAFTIPLPVGWYFAIRQTAGTVSITSAFDQALG